MTPSASAPLPVAPSGRLLIGNLDCEASWSSGGSPASAPSRRALETASAFATLMRVLAEPGDRLWTPLPVDPARLPAVEGLPQPELISGPLAALSPPELLRAWGETAQVAAFRARPVDPEGPACEARRRGTLAERIWRLPSPEPAVAARVNHRRYGYELSREWGSALPGSAWLESPAALERHLRGAGSRLDTWVLKAPLSTAGRQRLIARAGAVTAELLHRAARLIEGGGGALFEPWLPRLDDFGVCGLVGERRVRVLGAHRQHLTEAGHFRGITIEGESSDLPGDLQTSLEESAHRTGERLRRDGYRGPFGIDAFLYRDAGGHSRLQPLCEINARLSFGLIARLLAERAGALKRGQTLELRLATGDPIPRAPTVTPLLLPAGAQATAAWMVLR